jgi:hypothetical protein
MRLPNLAEMVGNDTRQYYRGNESATENEEPHLALAVLLN